MERGRDENRTHTAGGVLKIKNLLILFLRGVKCIYRFYKISKIYKYISVAHGSLLIENLFLDNRPRVLFYFGEAPSIKVPTTTENPIFPKLGF